MKTYQKLASLLAAIANCEKTINTCPSTVEHVCDKCLNAQKWIERHQNDIDLIMTMFPQGSGFDCGTSFEQLDNNHGVSTPEKLVFFTEYHHMDENGYYDGWTQHVITVTPSLQFGFKLKISGKNRNDIKDYIAECFEEILNRDVSSLG